MLTLSFIPSKFPRTTTRDEWREIWRWKRVTQKALARELERNREMLAQHINNAQIYGQSELIIRHRNDIIETMVNPPLLIHDKQGF